MRTDKEVIAEMKIIDPATRFTRHALRNLALQGVIPCVMVGRKRLFDLDLVQRFLTGEYSPLQPEAGVTQGKIRRLV
jgi:hypothetical protein